MTTSETGERGGFTLIEILLVVALIALLATIFIGGSSALLSDKAPSSDAQFWKACSEARAEALDEGKSVFLNFDPKARAFVLDDGTAKKELPFTGPDDTVIDFHPPQSDTSSAVLVGGTLVETDTLASVTFYNDGTCTPFRAQIFSKAGGAHLLSIDPWTCAQVLTKNDTTS
jgi:prepilin-type N-terminal cleavage/methylation domain-containing protein